jgi:O-antigen polymerase
MYLMDIEVEQRTPSAGATTHFREYPLKQRLFAGVLAVCIPLLVVPFMVTALHTASVVVRYERGGFRDPAILLGIVNPVPWLNRVEFNIHNIRFIAGMKTGDSAHLEDYVAWGKSFVHHTPRAAVYVNMVLALKALGRDDEANAMQLHARRLYPKLAWHSIATSSAAATLDSFSEAQ